MAGYRREYTLAEDKLILSWIVRIKAYYQLRGTRLWKDLEVAEIFEEDRTWQSLKNRFLKKVIPNRTNFEDTCDTLANEANLIYEQLQKFIGDFNELQVKFSRFQFFLVL
uniref:Telomeric repeat-binding factor 2-interacting protein 1 n=1 Tax=Diabrotica virgifera virgifera TaxID=50390 RepID=A0A6P7FTJ8_DIAVI